MAWLLSLVMGLLLGLAACASLSSTGRVIALVPGFPLPAEPIAVDPGEQVTWVNGDPVRGEVQVEFDQVPNAPRVSSKEGVHAARFGAPGTYPYTVTAHTPGGVELVRRRGEVVVRGRMATAEPMTGKTQASLAAPSPPAPRPTPSPATDPSPIGADIARLKGGADVYMAYHYRAEQGIVLRVDRGTAVPAMLSPGSQVILGVTYTVLVPPGAPALALKEVRTIRFGDQDLRRVEKMVTVASGTYSSEHRLTVPPDAAEGPYTVTTLIEVPSATKVGGQVSSMFSVRRP